MFGYKQSLRWPQLKHTWIVYEHQVEDLIHAPSTCDNDTMRSALEGVFLVQYQLSINDSNTVMVSGQRYTEYYDDYLEHLSHYAAQFNISLNPNRYSNALHDSVWATAIALNTSLQTIEESKIEILESANDELSNMSFIGTLSNVDFHDNGESKVATNIFQIRNGTAELYAAITDGQCNETAMGRSPDEKTQRVYNLQSAAITAVLLTIEAVLIILTTVILILFLYYRNAPEIKATSPYLMFLGCYSLFVTAMIEVISPAVIHDGVFFCNAPKWSYTFGLSLVFAPLIMRMLRVYRIFNYFGKLGKLWSDGVLFAGILLIVGVSIILFALWSVLDGISRVNNNVMLVTLEGSFPYYDVVQVRTPAGVAFLVLDSLQILLLYISVVVLAILTRKVRQQHLKGTKKVNIFIYSEVLIACILLPLAMIITDREIQVYIRFAQINSNAVLCQTFLFLPKCLPPLCRHLKLK